MKRLILLIVIAAAVLSFQLFVNCARPLGDDDPNPPIIIHDTVFYTDTMYLGDSTFIVDTVIIIDTVPTVDTFYIIDTINNYDTTIVIDTVPTVDTLFIYDTINTTDTLNIIDTIIMIDTVIYVDTFYNTDTINIYLPDSNLNRGSAVSTQTATLDQTVFDTITFMNKAASPRDQIDEIRFGTTFEAAIGAASGSDYEGWAGDFPSADLTDPDADFDGDGLTNNEERIWGMDPTSGGSVNPISTGLNATAGTLIYTRRDPALSGASFHYEWSTSLTGDGWTTFTPLSEDADGGHPVESVTITLDPGLLANPKLFVRVAATLS